MSTSRAAFVLVGPTASGKSAVAQYLAETRGYAILSADAMLVYRGMDIGTAKPSAAERDRVSYYGLDCVSPGERFSVWDYRARALEALEAIAGAGQRAIITGGSGLYVKSLTHGLDGAPADATRREHWEAVLAAEGVDALAIALRERAPTVYAALADPRNPRRLVRALEAAEADAERPRRQWADVPVTPLAALAHPSEMLRTRIEARVTRMYEQGLLDEVRGLLAQDGMSVTAQQAIGYAEAIAVIEGRESQEAAMAATVRRTWQLARRQRTWFRHQLPVHWIDVTSDEDVPQVAARVEAYWEEHGPIIIQS